MQIYIYLFDKTYHDQFQNVINELKKKIDISESCGYTFFEYQYLERTLQKIYRNNITYYYDRKSSKIQKYKHYCNCFFCSDTVVY